MATVVFLLPGFMMYFWMQSFGLNPVVRHSTIELTVISTLLWLPVAFLTLALFNAIVIKTRIMISPIWSLEEIQYISGNIFFLTTFMLLSVLVSLIVAAIWSIVGYRLQRVIVNIIRKWRGVTRLSKNSSVWDEVFLINEPQVVEYGKVGEEGKSFIGEIENVSRTFEPERLYLRDIDYYSDLIEKYKIPVSNIYIDTKSGTYIKIFSSNEIVKAINEEDKLFVPRRSLTRSRSK